MSDRKQDATGKLSEGAKTQKTEKGLKIGVPKRKEFFGLLERATGQPRENRSD
jgi:hypothetical protein